MNFTEVMEGNIYIGDDIEDFHIASQAAIDSGDTAHFYLSVNAWNTDVCKHCSDTPILPFAEITSGLPQRSSSITDRDYDMSCAESRSSHGA